MCGILGFWGHGQHYDSTFLHKLLNQQEHRGPDDKGYLLYHRGDIQIGRELPSDEIDAQVGLFHRRLSIIDLTDSGWQPMSTADNRYHIIFNGEIYNYIELRNELEKEGYQFQSSSDTEVLLVGYSHWGTAILPRLVGMFAFAIFDKYQEQLFLARDCFGIKPLYYAQAPDRLIFASEIKSILEFPEIKRRVNPNSLFNYLRYGMTDYSDETMFDEIVQLSAGHYLLLSLDKSLNPEPVCYWQPQPEVNTDISFSKAVSHVRELFLKNIQLHLRSDVPVGAALSGGIDSSSIVMAMREIQGSQLDLHTFSYIADDSQLSEEIWIDRVNSCSGAQAHKIYTDATGLVQSMKHLIYMQDEPFNGTSIYAQHRVFRLAHQTGIKVMLDGQGADEFLGGYRYYMAARLASYVRRGKFIAAQSFLRKVLRQPGVNAKWLISLGLGFLVPESLQPTIMPLAGEGLWKPWMNETWFKERNAKPEIFSSTQGKDALRDYLIQTISRVSLPHLLRYEDRNSMAYSVESRVPFLTPELVEFVLSLPENFIISDDGVSKSVFREAMRGIVPDDVLDRKDKVGFATPETAWLDEGRTWFDEVLMGDYARSLPVFKHQQIADVWRKIRENPHSFNPRKIWHWINLTEWSQVFDVVYE